MPEAAALVTEVLLLAVALNRLRVLLPVLFLVTGMRVPPLLAALAHDLGVEGIRANLSPVIIPAALLLAGGLAANPLLGTVKGRLKDLLAITTMARTHHQVAPDQNVIRSFCPEASLNRKAPTKHSAHIESPVEFFAASPRMGLLPIKPAELLLFYPGTDREVQLFT
jgi:hypothetical protein